MIPPSSLGVPETPESSRYRSYIQMCKDHSIPKSIPCPSARMKTKSLLTCSKNHLPTNKDFVMPTAYKKDCINNRQYFRKKREAFTKLIALEIF